jgi:hypothetical protein
MYDVLVSISAIVGRSEDDGDARTCRSARCVDRRYERMGVRRSYDVGPSRIGWNKIVGVTAAARDKSEVFDPRYRFADHCRSPALHPPRTNSAQGSVKRGIGLGVEQADPPAVKRLLPFDAKSLDKRLVDAPDPDNL